MKSYQNTEEKWVHDYFCAGEEDFECEPCFVEPALCLAFDDVDLAAWVVLLWDAVADLDVFDREL